MYPNELDGKLVRVERKGIKIVKEVVYIDFDVITWFNEKCLTIVFV